MFGASPPLPDNEMMINNPTDFYDKVFSTCEMLLSRKTDEALNAIGELQRERPEAPEVLYLMGIASITIGEYGRALMYLEGAHNRDPNCLEYSEALANLHVRVGNLSEGVYFAKLSTTLEPHPHVANLLPSDMTNFFESLENASIPRHAAYGFVKFHRHEYEDAAKEFDRQIMLKPDDAYAHRYAAASRLAVGEFERAILHIQKAIHLTPDDPDCHFFAGQISKRIGAFDAALFHFKKAFELDEESVARASACLALACELPDAPAEDLAALEKELQRQMTLVPERAPEATPSRRRKDRIHVCYVTNQGWHPDVAAVLEPILELHDRNKFDIYLYQQAQGSSAFIQLLDNRADTSRPLWELDDETATVVISGDEIDILVNMCSPDSDNRASLFTMAPATIQVGYLAPNFGAKMPGLTHVLGDPMTADALAAQIGEGQDLTSLRPGLWSVKPPVLLPDVRPLPAATSGHLTLGAMCDLEALTEPAVDLLAQILAACPGSRLLFGGIGSRDSYTKRRIGELFAAFGMQGRFALAAEDAAAETWMADPTFWHEIDLLVVPGRLSAPLRAADALWMGNPVLTMKGRLPAACSAASILASAAKLEWVFETPEALVETVKTFAEDLTALGQIRDGLREGMRKTALFNPVIHVRELEEIYTCLVDARGSED